MCQVDLLSGAPRAYHFRLSYITRGSSLQTPWGQPSPRTTLTGQSLSPASPSLSHVSSSHHQGHNQSSAMGGLSILSNLGLVSQANTCSNPKDIGRVLDRIGREFHQCSKFGIML